ncbi:MAG TPA: CcmD family protein [Gemmatimonadaceae bacterium]|nr:CcmD family protein [Gemmatimonadaceae bacterium]
MSDWNFVTAAYAVTWIGLVAYQLYLVTRGRAVRREAAERRELGEIP